ncbi:MAG: hypothetical protein M1838_002371 [Thelocarpon superellum]|nr:MAG: hypothetical protein M1838_002371 [Thelocarpon superellum]
MAPFIPLWITRSDGKLEVDTTAVARESNGPTASQLDAAPDEAGVCDFYQLLDPDDAKVISWRRKLAGMLAQVLKEPPSAGGEPFILGVLPENYRLYEHRRVTASDMNGKSKSTATASQPRNERLDAYLYGHPGGRKKRYRSPADFFPHLLWLATDPEGDPGNCGCKLCSPEEVRTRAKGSTVAVPPGSEAKKTVDLQPKGVVLSLDGKSPSPRQLSPQVVERSAPTSALGPDEAEVRIATTPIPSTKLPRVTIPRCREQEVDLGYNVCVFRPGEVVWYRRDETWGLALIAMRELYAVPQVLRRARYMLQPLSLPFQHPAPKIVMDDLQLRPWLAWSPPQPTHAGLQYPQLDYETIDWLSVLQGHAGPQGDAEVDASIFAARAVDESYTPFDLVSTPTSEAGETYWNGLFFGAEKIWVGDVIRLRGDPGDIMVVYHIVQHHRADVKSGVMEHSVHFYGDVYRFRLATQEEQPSPADQESLPPRVRMDLKYRNDVTARGHQETGYWKLKSSMQVTSMREVKGRWYESSLLLPILRGPENFASDIEQGQITDAGLWMNGRCNNSARHPDLVGVYHATRRDALGRSVPSGMRLGMGLDGPPEENIFPAESISSMDLVPLTPPALPASTLPPNPQEGDLDQFMHLDSLEPNASLPHYSEGADPSYAGPL